MNCAYRYVTNEETNTREIVGTFEHIPPGLFIDFSGVDDSDGMGFIKPVETFENMIKEFSLEGYIHETTPASYRNFIMSEKPNTIIPFRWEDIPEITKNCIMDHQIQAINAAIEDHNGRSCSAIPAGGGKTLVGSNFSWHYGKWSLFICPANKLKDWSNEIVKWTHIPASDIQIIDSSKDTIKRTRVICSYDMVKNHKDILKQTWTSVIVDECHMLKGESQRTKNIVPLLKSAKAVLLLSGTPQESRTAELYNILHALYPDVFSNREVFTARYSDGHYDKYMKWTERGSRNLDELHLLLSKFMFRSTYVLPTLKRCMVEIDVKNNAFKQKIDKIEAEQSEIFKELEVETDVQKRTVLENKRNVLGNELWMLSGKIKTSVAAELMSKIIQKHPEENIVFFAYHKECMTEIHRMLKEVAPPNSEIVFVNADVAINKRQAMLDPLRTIDPNFRKYAVLSIRTCGTGINLHPGVSVIVLIELDRMPGQMEQAEGRARRTGALRDITSYWFVLKHDCDKKTLIRLQGRKKTNSRVLDGLKNDKFEFDAKTTVVCEEVDGTNTEKKRRKVDV